MPSKNTKKMDRAGSARTLKRVLSYIKKYRVSVIFSIVLATVTVALTLYVPVLTGQAVDCILGPGQVDYQMLVQILLKIAVIVLITAAAQWLMNHINNQITYKVVKDIRTKAFNHLEVLPLSYLDRHPAGDVVSRIIADIDQFSEGLLLGFTQLFTGVMTILGTLLFMLSINPLITLVVVVITPVSFLVASFIAKRTFTMFQKQSEARGEMTSLIEESLGNLKVVQAFGHEAKSQEQFQAINRKMSDYSLRATFFSSITNPATRFVKRFGVCRSGYGRRLRCDSRIPYSRTAQQFLKLCQSVYQAF